MFSADVNGCVVVAVTSLKFSVFYCLWHFDSVAILDVFLYGRVLTVVSLS